MIFIGHLDMMRYFQKAIRRAELPIAYSTGFSPHQIMSFAAPLGVGLYSNGEYLDIELTTEMPTGQILEQLNQTMAEGVRILSVKALPENAGNAMASVAAAGYTITVRTGHEPAFPFGQDFDSFMQQSEIPYEKTTKKSIKTLDLKEGIFDYRVSDDSIYILVDASSSGNIKPGMVMDAYYQFCQTVPGEFDFVITREETYTREQSGRLIPLDDVGRDIS
jgi:radical SAM-linked protein